MTNNQTSNYVPYKSTVNGEKYHFFLIDVNHGISNGYGSPLKSSVYARFKSKYVSHFDLKELLKDIETLTHKDTFNEKMAGVSCINYLGHFEEREFYNGPEIKEAPECSHYYAFYSFDGSGGDLCETIKDVEEYKDSYADDFIEFSFCPLCGVKLEVE